MSNTDVKKEPPLRIDSLTGRVTLPNGFVVDGDLTRDEFMSGPQGDEARRMGSGDVLFMHGRFNAGTIEGHPLLANGCYFENMLVYLDLSVNLYLPHATDWSSYSLDTEAAIKAFHDRLLREQLGEPTREYPLSLSSLTPAQASLEKSLEWKFPWGRVFSAHDSKGGGTSFSVQYGDRLAEANRLYHQRVKR